MSFWITVAVPLSDGFDDNVAYLRDGCDMTFVPERKCWVGEVGDDLEGVATVVGGFACDGDECPFPDSWSKEKLLASIDRSCDFTAVGRKNR